MSEKSPDRQAEDPPLSVRAGHVRWGYSGGREVCARRWDLIGETDSVGLFIDLELRHCVGLWCFDAGDAENAENRRGGLVSRAGVVVVAHEPPTRTS